MTAHPAEWVYLLLILLLPLSALAARRLAWRTTARMAAAWLAIFAVGLVLVGQRERLTPVADWGSRLLWGERQRVVGQTTVVPMDEDGHFRVDATINGVRRRMLIDSGATTTALSVATATAAGVDTSESVFPVVLDTANGQVTGRTGTVDTLRVGGVSIERLTVVVSPAFGDSDVLGMNFLSRLAGWRVRGRTLILEPAR